MSNRKLKKYTSTHSKKNSILMEALCLLLMGIIGFALCFVYVSRYKVKQFCEELSYYNDALTNDKTVVKYCSKFIKITEYPLANEEIPEPSESPANSPLVD